jgi:hypothetical protein
MRYRALHNAVHASGKSDAMGLTKPRLQFVGGFTPMNTRTHSMKTGCPADMPDGAASA